MLDVFTALYSLEYTKLNFLIHSSTVGYLGYFYILAIALSAAMDIGVHMSFLNDYFWREMSRSGIVSLSHKQVYKNKFVFINPPNLLS